MKKTTISITTMRCKTIRYSFITGIVLCCLMLTVNAQKPLSKLERLKKVNAPETHTPYSHYLKKSTNEIELTAAVLFVSYKKFVSSQDMASCVFTPSCSVYAIESLQNDHPLLAYVKIFDRLSRCHPLTAKGQYPIDRKTMQLYDPVH